MLGAPKSAHGWIVLIVDDHYDNVLVAQTTLEFFGAKVMVANDGRQGLALVDSTIPTVILMDISMPVMDGWEMLSQVRNRPALKDVPIIAVTAHAMDGDHQKVISAGFDEYIPKPYDIQRLIPIIQAVLDKKK